MTLEEYREKYRFWIVELDKKFFPRVSVRAIGGGRIWWKLMHNIEFSSDHSFTTEELKDIVSFYEWYLKQGSSK